MDEELKKQVEAVLFSCGRKIELEEIGKLTGIGSIGSIKEVLKSIKKDYETRESPMMVMEDDVSWKMTVREKYLPVVRKVTPYMEFSKTLMETLAVVAWKQPIMQSDVIRIRTNKAYDHIGELEKMGFLSKERHGRSYILKLSQKFYDYFDLRNDVDVRNLFKHIKDIEPEQKKVAEYADDKPDETKTENSEQVVPDEKIEEQENGDTGKEDKKNDTNSEMPEVQKQDVVPTEDKKPIEEN